MRYVGRFAPSPTGPLHAGSLATALACACDALAHDGVWHLRIEDLDPPRTVAGAARGIVDTLQACGFRWHGEIVAQSQRDAAYRAAFAALDAGGYLYPCACSRRDVQAAARGHSLDGEPIYPGTCRDGVPNGRIARSWRMRMPDADITFVDRWHGVQRSNLQRDHGDGVLRRADGWWAYPLAVVVDDIALGVTDIVRGDDLLHATARQYAIYDALAAPRPLTLHVPVVRNARGEKLSKQTGAPAIDPSTPLAALEAAAAHLGIDVAAPTLAAFWRAAPAAWAARLRLDAKDRSVER